MLGDVILKRMQRDINRPLFAFKCECARGIGTLPGQIVHDDTKQKSQEACNNIIGSREDRSCDRMNHLCGEGLVECHEPDQN